MVKMDKETLSGVKNGLTLAKVYYIVAMLKFPLVMSRNGILNGIIAILFIGGICSSIGNYLIDSVLRKTGEKTYTGISEQSMGKMHIFTQICMFIFRCIALFYMIDLSFRLLRSMGIENIVDPKYVSVILWLLLLFVAYFVPDPNIILSGLTRNTITVVLMLTLTIVYCALNTSSNIDNVYFLNPSDTFFSSYALTFICFAQQIATTPILTFEHSSNMIQIITGGVLSSLVYIVIGTLGYLSSADPNVNWCFNVKHTPVREITSFIFLTMNILQYPVVFNPICSDIQGITKQQKNNKVRAVYTFILTTILIPASLMAVASKHLQFPCLIFSAIIMIVLPCFFFIRAKEKSRSKNFLAFTNLSIAGFFIGKACVDWLQV